MKKLIAMVCFMLAASPFAFAQDKAKDDASKVAPAVEVKADSGKDASKKSEKSKGDEKKTEKARRERTLAQKANDERLKECNAEAGDKKGDERKKFMSACMKEKQKSQHVKMSACNKEATDKKLKGDDRKTFIKGCLSAKPSAAQPAPPAKK